MTLQTHLIAIQQSIIFILFCLIPPRKAQQAVFVFKSNFSMSWQSSKCCSHFMSWQFHWWQSNAKIALECSLKTAFPVTLEVTVIIAMKSTESHTTVKSFNS